MAVGVLERRYGLSGLSSSARLFADKNTPIKPSLTAHWAILGRMAEW